jgi:RNA polymerase sigma-70 factor (ECF subfamily)
MEDHLCYLLARARHLTRDEADARDLVQDTCLHALEKLAAMDAAPENLRAWLYVVMRNHWFNVVRHRRVRREAARAMTEEDARDASLCETRASAPQLRRAWASLSEQSREIAERCLLDEQPYERVSESVGVSTAAVATSIHRTRARLKETMFGS